DLQPGPADPRGRTTRLDDRHRDGMAELRRLRAHAVSPVRWAIAGGGFRSHPPDHATLPHGRKPTRREDTGANDCRAAQRPAALAEGVSRNGSPRKRMAGNHSETLTEPDATPNSLSPHRHGSTPQP